MVALKALEEALDAASGGAPSEEGAATAELRGMLRCEGVGGGSYYAGPRWLPPYFALLGILSAPTASHGREAGQPAHAVPHACQQAKALLLGLASERGGMMERAETGDGLPDELMYRLLQFFGGLTRHAPAHEPFLLGRLTPPAHADDREKPTFSKADTYALLHQWESLKYTMLNTCPNEAANNRTHELPAEERAISLALSESLATAMIDEAGAGSRGTCWGAGLPF